MTNGIPVTIAKAKGELQKYRHGLKVMSGGLTVSGGEPLMQHRFVIKLFRAAQEMGIHTALDTNGYFGDRLSDDDLNAVSLVLLDIKSWDQERHQRLTGMDGRPTREFARRLAANGKPIWLRFVLVPGLTDDEEDISKIAAFAAELGNVQRVDVLPFHQMGRYKWKVLNRDYILDDVQPPSPELVERTCAQFRAAGLSAM
jgi:pyruvate formate lyase activating enzyme